MITTVVFDVGETLVDETRIWSLLADRASVTRLTLFAALGWLIAEDSDHRLVWDLLGVKPPSTGGIAIERSDIYPDAPACLTPCAPRATASASPATSPLAQCHSSAPPAWHSTSPAPRPNGA